MASIEELRAERIKKLEKINKAGINPYPASSLRTNTIKEVLEMFERLKKEQKEITVAGRVMVARGQGAIRFIDIRDGGGKIQAVLKKDVLDEKSFKLFGDVIDAGDFIEVSGILFVTQKGERSIEVNNWRILSKTLLPLPDKWHGLVDEDQRLRKRYLDILLNDDLRNLIYKRAKFWDTVRSFMKKKGFLEVETPTLETTTGGAEARPFNTYHNDFDMNVFLRISAGELWQKRLMAAGMEKTFEIGRVYRNEGTSANHVQEFTNMEFYWAYADYKDGMKLTQELYQHIAIEVFGSTKFKYGEYEFDLSGEWGVIDYHDEILRQTGIDLKAASEEEIKKKLEELNVKYDGNNKERLTDTLWKYCRKNIAGPVFLINHPKLVSPLAKEVEDNPEYTQRFQPIIAGIEIGNGYSELNNPIEQRARFEIQQELLKNGDEEAMMPDWEFVEMLEHGMPPTCGFGFGERLFAVLANKSIREVQLFPLVKNNQ